LFLSSCQTPTIFLPWENENDNDSVNSLLERNHYSVDGKKDCSFSEGQDINQEVYSFVIKHSVVLGIYDVILNPEKTSAIIDSGTIKPFLQEYDHKPTRKKEGTKEGKTET